MRLGKAVLVLAAMLASALVADRAEAAELRVGPDGYPSVTAAIQAAEPGDVLRIAPGQYRENIVLSKTLTLVGEGMPQIDGGGNGDVILVTAPNCRISGLHVTGSGRAALTDSAAIKLTAPGALIEGNLLDQSLYGIYLESVQHAVIRDNEIQGLADLPPGDRGDGIRLFDSQHNRISNNRISVTRDGIYFNASPFNTLTGNAVRQARYGLHYMYSDDNTFSQNRFTESEAGSAVMFSRRLTLRDNLFSGNRGFRDYGLLIKDCEQSIVEGNAILGNRVGIFMDGAIGLTVAGNRVVGNDLGIEVRGSSEANDFRGNTIAGNAVSAALPTGRSENRWDGNYWSDYRGYDLDGNERGDVPHQAGSVFAYLTENMPPARLFLLSPAIQALEFAERTFPIVNVPNVTDPSPSTKPTVEGEAKPLGSGGIDLPMLGISLGALLLGILPLIYVRKAFSA
jgi:nitrous oxidase accessory protein